MFLTPFWKIFSVSDKMQIWSLFFKFCKYFLCIPIWTCSEFSRWYGVFEICWPLEANYWFSADLPSIKCLASQFFKSYFNPCTKAWRRKWKMIDSVIFMEYAEGSWSDWEELYRYRPSLGLKLLGTGSSSTCTSHNTWLEFSNFIRRNRCLLIGWCFIFIWRCFCGIKEVKGLIRSWYHCTNFKTGSWASFWKLKLLRIVCDFCLFPFSFSFHFLIGLLLFSAFLLRTKGKNKLLLLWRLAS